MGAFHDFLIVQLVTNRAMHRRYSLVEKIAKLGLTLHKKCRYLEFFMVRIFPY